MGKEDNRYQNKIEISNTDFMFVFFVLHKI